MSGSIVKTLTYGHAVMVEFISAALLTYSQTLFIQHVQQTDGTHLFLLILHTGQTRMPLKRDLSRS